MIVTNIKRKGKSETYYVYVNDEFFSVLEAEIIYKHKVKIGAKFSEKDLQEIKRQSDMLLCASYALNYVAKALKTKKQVQNYLKGKNFEDEAINEAVLKLQSYGYLNDNYYAQTAVKQMSQTKGKMYIKNQLLQKGVNQKDITDALNLVVNEDQTCLAAAQKWFKGKELPLDAKNKQKLYRHLAAKGFDFETIKHAMAKFYVEREDDWY